MTNKKRFITIGALYICAALFLFPIMPLAEKDDGTDDDDEQSIIIEVDGDTSEHKDFIEKNYPQVDVVATYDTIFNGLALKAPKDKLHKVGELDFIQSIHPSRTYEVPSPQSDDKADKKTSLDASGRSFMSLPEHGLQRDATSIAQNRMSESLEELGNIPSDLNDTSYTGEDVKVGVIDTGIDYTHPDLQENFSGGYDLVDLDDDPMETKGNPLEETMHGTHVSGTIAADGNMEGVAPDAEIHAYRALGPGGQGSSVQILAALEKAVKDDMDLINLSLGNAVNGPDYPTSVAVNRAVEHGVTVVIASGNDGPDDWTVGSPATASKAVTVGATSPPMDVPVLHEGKHDKSFAFDDFMGAAPWDLEKDYEIMDMDGENDDVNGKIALFERGKVPFYKMAKEAEDEGAEAVLIANNEKGPLQGSVENDADPVDIPVGALSKTDGDWLREQLADERLYLDTNYEETERQVADFSSRGPVTINWAIKPDVLAPGVQILSTVPDGYGVLQGTSMATPHVTGVLALIKEAHPDWSPAQLKSAIETTATPIEDDDEALEDPTSQGLGRIEPKDAIETPAMIDTPSLSLGKVTQHDRQKKAEMTVTNTSDEEQQYSFETPDREQGVTWDIPKTFSVGANEEKTLEIDMRVMPKVVDKGIHQGHLSLNEGGKEYHLPYLFVNQTADYPKAMGFEFSLKELSDDTYQYQLYMTEAAKKVRVDLYDPDTLIYKQSLLTLKDTYTGMNEGEMDERDLGDPGYYKAIITVELEDGSFESYETEVAF